MDYPTLSPACDAVLAADHPIPENGGPCETCAFRPGTEANRTAHTMELARLCVEGLRLFHCHEKVQVCRGFNAAVNLRGLPETEEERQWAIVAGEVADILSEAIQIGVEADRAASIKREAVQLETEAERPRRVQWERTA